MAAESTGRKIAIIPVSRSTALPHHPGKETVMNITPKKLGEAELEIMQAIWNSQTPVTSNFILKALEGKRHWKLPSLMTSLSRLADKGFVSCDRSTGTNLYSALISENDYKADVSGSFLKKLYNNSLHNMVATLYNNQMLKDADVEELRDFLNRLEKEQ